MRSIRIGNFFGIKVFLHYSWFFVVAFIAYVLATGFFPQSFPDQSTATYWTFGFISAILLFGSVLLHELSHSIVAKKQDLRVASITLFFFGGVASIDEAHLTPRKEFLMSIAGPLMSIALAAVFYSVHFATDVFSIVAISSYLYRINLMIAIFNMVPGFPLDGGRVFRSIVWGITKDHSKATRMASFGGKVFAYFLLFVGLANVFTGSFAGLWFVIIGGFLLLMTTLSYEQALIQDLLKGRTASDFVEKHVHTHAPDVQSRTPAFKVFQTLAKSDSTYVNVYKGKEFLGIIRKADIINFIYRKNTEDYIKKNRLEQVRT